jgi:hypothetical protein
VSATVNVSVAEGPPTLAFVGGSLRLSQGTSASANITFASLSARAVTVTLGATLGRFTLPSAPSNIVSGSSENSTAVSFDVPVAEAVSLLQGLTFRAGAAEGVGALTVTVVDALSQRTALKLPIVVVYVPAAPTVALSAPASPFAGALLDLSMTASADDYPDRARWTFLANATAGWLVLPSGAAPGCAVAGSGTAQLTIACRATPLAAAVPQVRFSQTAGWSGACCATRCAPRRPPLSSRGDRERAC